MQLISDKRTLINGGDIATMVVYFVILFAVFIYSVVKSNRSSAEGYFLANRSMNWFLIGMSLFSTNIGAEHFLGLAGSGAAKGLSAAAFEINAMLVMQMLSWVFLPVLVSARVRTLPEYFSTRFGGNRIRCLLAVVYLIIYILTKVSVNLYAGAVFLQLAFDFNLYVAIVGILTVTALFAVVGGLTSVMYTDTLMTIVMLGGGTALSAMALKEVNGFHGLYNRYLQAIPNSSVAFVNSTLNHTQCGLPQRSAFQMLRGLSDSYIPWLVFFLGHTPNTIWYWCSDQMMVQRVLSAKSLSHAKGGTLLTGFLKISPIFLMVLVGMVSRSLYPDTVGCISANSCIAFCGNPRGCSNLAYPSIALGILPSGLRGVILAVMISALISGLTSLYNSSSTLFTLDVYNLVRKKAGNMELMIVGRVFALIIIALSIGWIPLVILVTGTDIYVYIQSVNSFYAAPIASVYLMAVFWQRMTEKGAFFSLVFGFIIGTIRLALEMSIPAPICGEADNRFLVVSKVNFMYFSLMSFLLTSFVNILVSLFTSQPDFDKFIKHKTFWTRLTNHKNGHISEANNKKEELSSEDISSDPLPQSENEFELMDDEVDSVKLEEKTPFYRKMAKVIAAVFGIKKQAQPNVDYNEILSKFNEHNQSTKSKYLTSVFFVLLAIAEFVIFLVFSLPSLPLFT